MSELAIPKREYETIYILKPETGREATESLAKRLSDVVKTDGRMTRVENWGRRRLAFDVQNNKRGLYIYMTYEAAGDVVPEVERALRLHESVMKFQTVKISDKSTIAEVAVEDVQFQHLEDEDGEEDETYAESLGLEARSNRWAGGFDANSNSDDDDSESGDGDSGDDAKGASADAEENDA